MFTRSPLPSNSGGGPAQGGGYLALAISPLTINRDSFSLKVCMCY